MTRSILLFFAAACAAVPSFASVDLYLFAPNSSFVADPGATVTLPLIAGSNSGSEPSPATVTVPLPPESTLISAGDDHWSCTRGATGELVCETLIGAQAQALNVRIALPPSLEGSLFQGTAKITAPVADARPNDNIVIFTLRTYRTLQVTTPADGSAGSLRAAIESANALCHHQNECKIVFTVPMTIEPQTPLPAVASCGLIVDGGTVADDDGLDRFERPRRVEISGARVASGNGLELRGTCNEVTTIRGLAINRFPENGILVATAPPPPYRAGTSIDTCFIGTDVTGTAARPNGLRGIAVDEPASGGTVYRSIISGNTRSGIAIYRSSSFSVRRCFIGSTATGDVLPNGASGIYTNAGSLSVSESTIVANHEFGIAAGDGAEHVVLLDDFIDGNGGIALDWGMDGPSMTDRLGRMPAVPRLLDAFYDPAANETVVRGVVAIDNKGSYSVAVYMNGPTSAGYGGDSFAGSIGLPDAAVPKDVPFEIHLRGDARGLLVTALTQRALDRETPVDNSSELSAAIRVR